MKSLTILAEDGNKLDIPEDQLQRLRGEIRRGSIAQLSPDREAVPFMFFAIGNDWDSISNLTNIPRDILYATALYYKWPEKISALRSNAKEFDPESMLGDVYNMSLVVLKHGMQEMVKEVMSGEKKISQFPLFPKNLHSFEKFFAMLEKLKEFSGDISPVKKGTTVVQAQNVQINQSGLEPGEPIVVDPEEEEARRKERELKYKMLRGES